ncbi:eukaryotic translation initiation factor 3 subunit G-domain-containing protein [Halteromyces radiatus]|uniref:eukaryotic translation initiation factor 3 subunit G-domain-containing protein n=1 Tax=Halteromyces radiatus TaxID=101107 RepID=UPI0022212996|nr:eukaryotic translation initiation factor 3 subunit G-domain-containing protein [Halteromyces radiatus]KAI8083005.1 eukaryotic translation initiation factor 3 subunit G-domain-containing protein [Halteromyces radiatus]
MNTMQSKSSWADDIEDEDPYQSKVFTDENGIKHIVEYKENDAGKKVKITRKIRSTLKTEHVNKAVAQRKKWAKFGEEEGNKPGPDLSTTTIGENIPLKLGSKAGKSVETAAAEEAQDKVRSQLKSKNIMCRICKGEHFTSKCPYKDTLQPLDEIASSLEAVKMETSDLSGTNSPEPVSAGGPSKYTPPHLRNKAAAAAGGQGGESMRDRRDDNCTLRVTNLSEDVVDNDIHDLFRRFGNITRVFLARDRETRMCKGFAFVSFADREDAERAQQAINGYGYDNLILRVEFARSQ